MPQHWLTALLTPAGRLPQAPFAILAMALFAGNYWAFNAIANGWQEHIYGGWTIALLVMMWSTFCIFSRRMRDVGNSGALLVPLFLLAVVAFLAAIDPELFGIQTEGLDKLGFVVEHGTKFMRGLVVAVFIYCVKAQGNEGPNAYGLPFGERADDGSGRLAVDDVGLATAGGGMRVAGNFNRARTAASAGAGDWKRERPRGNGFGRR